MRAKNGVGAWLALAVVGAWPFFSGGCGGSSSPAVGEDVDSGIDSGVDTGGGGDAPGTDGDPDPVCGNKIKEGVEECDDGNTVNGDGCENDCTFVCKPGDPLRGDVKCDDKNVCTGTETCGADHICTKGTPLSDGASCGTTKVCAAGACVDTTCGDKIVSTGEECDDGNAAGGDGCETTCKFTCVSTDSARDCTPTDPCKGKGACADATHICSAGTPLVDGTACGTGKTCKTGVCTSVLCGNSTVDAGEECDPPAAGTCDASCHKIVVAACGNGTREAGEQCDDHNTTNLDGCSSTCKFEQDMRANGIQMIYNTSICAKNALGGAIGGAAQGQIKTSLDSGVKDGSTSLIFEFLNLSDLTGTSEAGPTFALGGLGGKPAVAPTGKTYDGTADLDWWYTSDPAGIDAARLPTATLKGGIKAKALTAGPGTINLLLTLSAGPSAIKVTNSTIKGTIGATSKPTVSTGATPGHLATENVDPAILTFATMSGGQMCGNVSALSLSKVPAPAAITGGGALNCAEKYTPANSLLDVVVGGCTVFFIPAVRATQPDQVDAGVTAVGAGGAYTLVAGAGKAITGCKDKSGATVDLAKCLDAAAYSASFTFTMDRVIAK